MSNDNNTSNMSARDINLIINAGFKANCEKIEYNGLIITYSTPKPSAVVSYLPLVEENPSPQDHDAAADSKHRAIKETIDDKMFTNPLDFEQES